jgi:hypothetical protein
VTLIITWIWFIMSSKYFWGVFDKMLGKAACATELGPRIRLDKSNKPGRIDSTSHNHLKLHTMTQLINTFECILAIVHSNPAYSPSRTNITFSQTTTRENGHLFGHWTHKMESITGKYLSFSMWTYLDNFLFLIYHICIDLVGNNRQTVLFAQVNDLL